MSLSGPEKLQRSTAGENSSAFTHEDLHKTFTSHPVFKSFVHAAGEPVSSVRRSCHSLKYAHITAQMVTPAYVSAQPLSPPPSLADDTFSSWLELRWCLERNEIYKEESLGMPAMRQQVPSLAGSHMLAFIDCIMACMKMVSH